MRLARLIPICALQLAAFLFFGLGFFPVSQPSGERNSWDGLNTYCVDPSRTVVNRTVIMLVDALRADFALGPTSPMPFLRDQIAKRGLGLVGHTQAPTVTMPRIKALTTGTVPGFIDAILNMASTELRQDSWIHQLRHDNRTIRFFGDDTWLRLFPGAFELSDGTTSFFVNDFTEVVYKNLVSEVDDNVTRHLSSLASPCWSVSILHYLGLDHIGHSLGPRHPQLEIKLREMDEVLKRTVAILDGGEDWAVVVVGDHGMSEMGSHGGASTAETSVPIVILSPKLDKEGLTRSGSVEQIDLVPALSLLWGTPTPLDSLGLLPKSLSAILRPPERLLAHWINTRQLLEKGSIPVSESLSARVDARMVELCSGASLETDSLINELISEGGRVREGLLASASEYRMPYLLFGLLLALSGVVLSVCSVKSPDPGAIFLCLLSTAALGSSSFIEEEHQIFYFAWPTLLMVHIYTSVQENRTTAKRRRPHLLVVWPLLGLLMLHRLCRVWNQTGDKWAHLPDIAYWLLLPEQEWIRKQLASCALGLLAIIELRRPASRWKGRVSGVVFCSGLLAAFLHHTAMAVESREKSRGWKEAWAVYASVPFLLLLGEWRRSVLVLASLLLKTVNLPLLLLLTLEGRLLARLHSPSLLYAATASAYFYFGNSNSLGCVDLGSGYKGFSDFYPALSAPLIFFHTFLGPILLASFWPRSLEEGWILVLRFTPASFSLLMAFLQRHHLFVWSVFAPKLIFELCHTLLLVMGLLLSRLWN